MSESQPPSGDVPEPLRQEIEDTLIPARQTEMIRQWGALLQSYRRLADRYPDELAEILEEELERLRERQIEEGDR